MAQAMYVRCHLATSRGAAPPTPCSCAGSAPPGPVQRAAGEMCALRTPLNAFRTCSCHRIALTRGICMSARWQPTCHKTLRASARLERSSMRPGRNQIRLNPATLIAGRPATSVPLIGRAPGPLTPITPPDISGIILAALCVAAPWAAVGATRRFTDGADQDGDGALQILRDRYARGEIGQEEFQQRQRDLASSSSASSARGERTW